MPKLDQTDPRYETLKQKIYALSLFDMSVLMSFIIGYNHNNPDFWDMIESEFRIKEEVKKEISKRLGITPQAIENTSLTEAADKMMEKYYPEGLDKTPKKIVL